MSDEKDTRGLFGYEGEGYLGAIADEVEHEVDEHVQTRFRQETARKKPPADSALEPPPGEER